MYFLWKKLYLNKKRLSNHKKISRKKSDLVYFLVMLLVRIVENNKIVDYFRAGYGK